MPVGLADLRKAINDLWDLAGLDSGFTQFWTDSEKSEFVVLNDQEAAPSQPWPYCVFEFEPAAIVTRMSGSQVLQKHHTHDIPLSFRVHARQISGSGSTPAKIASVRAEEIMLIFGGHPASGPDNKPQLENGSVLILQYEHEFGLRTGDDEYRWEVRYNVRSDVPISFS